ncbi:hypothetical protein ZWY2020_033618, partial [Hordeum vulgare]
MNSLNTHDANDMQSHKLGDAMFDEDDLFSSPTLNDQIYYDESMPPIYDDYCDDTYAIKKKDDKACHNYEYPFTEHYCFNPSLAILDGSTVNSMLYLDRITPYRKHAFFSSGIAHLSLISPARCICMICRVFFEFKLCVRTDDQQEDGPKDDLLIEGCTEFVNMFKTGPFIKFRRMYGEKCGLDMKFL